MVFMRDTIIFGNGLGMALDPSYFRLAPAMENAWNDPNCLNDNQRRLIQNCLQAQGAGDKPTNEDDLDILHIAVNACEFLDTVANHDDGWLTNDGKEFPVASRTYLTNVAWYFHRHHHALPASFLEPLFSHIKKTKTHVATLNYDNLMYQKMIEAGILAGYDGYLVDGVYDSGFKDDNLRRMGSRNFGYYLHLHGTPLYVEHQGTIYKQPQASAEEIPTKHLVLAHVRHKPTIIDASDILSAYWNFLSLALQESSTIFIFGYSGYDNHLNRLIEAQAQGKKIHVVEWSGAGKDKIRKSFWQEKLKCENITLTQKDNILEFAEWS